MNPDEWVYILWATRHGYRSLGSVFFRKRWSVGPRCEGRPKPGTVCETEAWDQEHVGPIRHRQERISVSFV
jgi:hypothetical protein